jgi:signal transduction histidine kinase/DNA-binding response OmpR family regulator
MEATAPVAAAENGRAQPPVYRVLTVDDNPGDSEYLGERLYEAPATNFEIHQASSLAEAMSRLDELPVDAIFLDLNLPDAQGLTGLQQLQHAAHNVPIVVLSGLIDESLRQQAIANGAEDVFAKSESNSRLFPRSILYILERNRAKEQHRQVARLLDSTPDAILVANTDGKVEYVNEAALQLFRRTREDFVGERLAFSVGDGEPVELRIPRADGTRICEMRVVSYEWQGRPAYLAALRDLTERHKTEAELLQSNRDLARAQQIACLGSFSRSLERGVSHWSEELYRILDLDPAKTEPGLAAVLEVMHPDDRDAFELAVEQAVKGGDSLSLESRILRPNGEVRYLECRIECEEISHGKVERISGTAMDITDRKLAELQRDEFRQQLLQSQKMEAIGQLAGGVAHDFNNMLAIILGYSELLTAQYSAEDPVHGDLTEIQHAAERAADITRQLLAFSRQQVLAPRVLNPNKTIEDTRKMLQRLIGEDITVEATLDPTLNRIVVDPSQLVQVIMNLAVNARDAMPQGGKLTIETRNLVVDGERVERRAYYQPGPHVMLSVSDTGCGMPPDVQRQIFEPFFTTKGPGRGTGLGLSTVYGIVKQSGGHIEVYSELNIGTTFKLYFPAVEEASAVVDEGGPALVGGSECILVVEDEPAVRRITERTLLNLGYEVLVAAGGAEAVELVRSGSQKIDLLLTDFVMPELSGREAAEEIKLVLPRIRILYMSGYTDDAVVRHGLITNEVAFINKPFSPARLAIKVREVLDAKLPIT